MKDVPADTPFIFFYRFICVSPLQDFVGVMSTLISPLDMIAHPVPALLRPQCLMTSNKAIVAESCRGVQVENASSPREPAYPFIIICNRLHCEPCSQTDWQTPPTLFLLIE